MKLQRDDQNLFSGHTQVISAVILAAGVGNRLGAAAANEPKILLEIGGKTLLERHFSALRAHGIVDVTMTIGYEGDEIRRAVDKLGLGGRIRFVENARYREGSIVSLWAQHHHLQSGAATLVMDGDVLYDHRMIGRLLAAPAENVLLIDRNIEPGDEPVKICFRDDVIVDFRKKPEHAHDWHGESVGFFRFSPTMSRALAERCAWYVDQGHTNLEYEEAIRDLILEYPRQFGAEDISDLPWVEIDFESDVSRARQDVLPQLEA